MPLLKVYTNWNRCHWWYNFCFELVWLSTMILLGINMTCTYFKVVYVSTNHISLYTEIEITSYLHRFPRFYFNPKCPKCSWQHTRCSRSPTALGKTAKKGHGALPLMVIFGSELHIQELCLKSRVFDFRTNSSSA